MPNCLMPQATLLCKLGAIAVHADEMLSPGGHQFDEIALRQLLVDPEVNEWLAGMRTLTLITEKRNA